MAVWQGGQRVPCPRSVGHDAPERHQRLAAHRFPDDRKGVLPDRRFEVRNHTVSQKVDWYATERSYPVAPRFPQLTTIAMVESRIERGDKIETERRSYISSRALSAAARAASARSSSRR